MAARTPVILFLVLVAFIWLSPNPNQPPLGLAEEQPTLEDVIAEEQRSLSVLVNSTWDPQFATREQPLNLTGLDPENGYAWDALPRVTARARGRLGVALGEWGLAAVERDGQAPNPIPLYSNITGSVRGHWVRSKISDGLQHPQLNLSAFSPPTANGDPRTGRDFDRNITGETGYVSVSFDDRKESVGAKSLPGIERDDVIEMSVQMKLTDPAEWEISLHGVYFSDLGQAILTTTSDKFAGIFMLPHLALSERTFELTRKLLNESISGSIQRQVSGLTDLFNPWSSRTDPRAEYQYAAPECDMIVYLQQLQPVGSSSYSPSALSTIERELAYPSGAFLPIMPDLHFSMLAFSPDCGYILESQGPPNGFFEDGDHLTGPKTEVYSRHSRHHLLAYDVVLALQVWLLKRQMREASTPSTRSKISFYTIAALALGDGFASMTFLLISLAASGLWTNLVVTGFLAFMGVLFFGMRFLMDIWIVQAPERVTQAREQVEAERRRDAALQVSLDRIRAERLARIARDAPTTAVPAGTGEEVPPVPAPTPSQPMEEMLPLPVTAQRPIDTGATPVFFLPSDQQELDLAQQPNTTTQDPVQAAVEARSTSFGSIYTRFYLLLIAILFLCINATTWARLARRIFFTSLALLHLSFWVPQIHRNIQRNTRHALNWEFVAGQSILRLIPFAYFYGYKQNALFADVDYYSLALLAVWVWLQVIVLLSQEFLAPRWFVRNDWAPPAYDYHPILREDEEGATMPIGFAQALSTPSSPIAERGSLSPDRTRRASIPKETKDRGKRIFDCAICMQELEVPFVPAGAAKSDAAGFAGGLLARRMYMVTPCRHIFHSACLEGWMKYRLQCPICREGLPAL